ncbi:protein LplC [Anaerocolumna cellulosilytica]|uniref:Protein LplC n=1 Tax=Anaerocolumna cellulosilytica TaxID=433286 RepID=A0A6S6R0J5_9FIRM|nr:carbohydrate ABC transporter permease [Anaerocolumna cellulosilytica]MBB5197801.1 putative aldouronate transport system permease protein [Anaerocolumna cellulosilytica]BCJ96434.1 protein LplC [Anaerocolumna cellulosilytica]
MNKKKKNVEFAESQGTSKIKVGDIVIMVIITLLCLTCILPFIHLAAKSVSSNTAVLSKSIFLLPKGINFDAYISIFKDGQLTHSMVYSVLVTVLFTIVGLILTTCAAYPLSRKNFKGRNIFALLLLFSMYFSAGLIPEYLLMKDLGLLNTMWVLILPLAFSPYNTLIMKSFLQATIPDSLEESAKLDGATNFQILFRIVLPLSKSIIATLALFFAVGRWNAYADAKYYITTKALQPIQYLLSNMVLNSSSDSVSLSEAAQVVSTPEVLQAATIMFATLPIICIYPFVQKYFVKGVMIGAVKG